MSTIVMQIELVSLIGVQCALQCSTSCALIRTWWQATAAAAAAHTHSNSFVASLSSFIYLYSFIYKIILPWDFTSRERVARET